ncbi:AAA family ATPase [Sporomusa sp. KB1]|jgi:AAA+ superfamily predicted ATPase|uniref:AAA family ATPase n=1 Tax=Sporomusa sp. KB1 TaxID=943346 RepID=UPI0011A339FE|nr:ATP-binding protein [Sporomusa sp. KB1]TWH47979.1 putative ATPase (AAA+ superfamily) [Sporomusa sp. KB1]
MATGEQIKALIKAHFENSSDRFATTALQVAAHEARQGHDTLAEQIRDIVQKSKPTSPNVSVIQFKREISDLIVCNNSENRLTDLIVPDPVKNRLKRILTEFKQQEKLRKFGLKNRRKILITGPPGTGKTLTASVLAGELHLPLMVVMMDKLLTKFMGETSARLRQIFDTIQDNMGVYLFDEFDTIGADRAYDNDVGEMRRVLNSFLMFIEQDNSSSIIIAATNNVRMLDQALFRRFDDVLQYERPTDTDIEHLIKNRVSSFIPASGLPQNLIIEAKGLSHAEIVQACDDALKDAVLQDKISISPDFLIHSVQEKKNAYDRVWGIDRG